MPKPPDSTLSRLGRFTARRRWLVIGTWLLLLVVAAVGGPKVAGEWSVDYSTPGSDSRAATDALTAAFPERSGDAMTVVWRATSGPAATPEVQREVQRTLDRLAEEPSLPPADARKAQVSPDGTTAMLELPLAQRTQTVVEESREALLAASREASTDDVQVRFGGFVMREAERGEISSENVGLAVALGILLLTFGSVVAAGLPIATALMGIAIASALIGLIARVVGTPDWAESLAVMVGIGVGIDYALLILTRHRAALRAGVSVEDAIAGAMHTAGRSVLVAGSTVVVALLGLLLMGLPYLTGVAFSAGASVLVVMLASLTLLPALLALAGRKVDALAIGLPGRRRGERDPGEIDPRFARWARSVQRHPWRATLAGVAVLAVLTAPITSVWLGFPGLNTDPLSTQARQSADLIARGFGPGAIGPMQIVVPTDSAQAAGKIEQLRRDLAADPRIVAVSDAAPSPDGSIAVISAQGNVAPSHRDAADLLHHVRDDIVPSSGTGAMVGGWAAENADQSEATAARLPLLFIGVAGLSALLLLVSMRSVWIPVKAAVLNLLSILASYGVVSLVAQGGFWGGLLGIDTATPIPPFIPVLMFAVLFGLSMDYEVFLIGRIRELWLQHGDPQRAVADGLAATARVITAAAAIMIAVFGAFALADEIFLKLIGIGMAVAILVDATIIRLLLVPAIMSLLGDRAWWLPGWLDRIVPHAELEGGWEPEAATAGAEQPSQAPGEPVSQPA